jgi:hypothetical protein
MALTKLRGAVPSIDELCRISSVQTLPDTLWVTARFLDGATRSFRPENIRPATKDEACASEEISENLSGGSAPLSFGTPDKS